MDSSYGQGSSYAEPGYGWLFFAGSMMGIAGIMRVFDGIWALRTTARSRELREALSLVPACRHMAGSGSSSARS